ncbi:enoyl-CoA hydratase-related protein [Parvularcula sp. LCG005]|uniref:enoyl-CoA hydratase-related protein n=1 Tax=Parvularcula sp. LCG005 TaxID=3078805 RepID=UPI0029435399|nr:enoyl-CoA hydratase-related protein [Parvularcula sp. LCG005]WOI52645.1 enoyl-CoA hydratase-related protein [Parvularcula sp. LCG005]
MSDHIKTSTENGVLRIRLAREDKKNALTIDMYEALVAAFSRAEDTPDIRVIMLEGGDEIFTAGNDLKAFATGLLGDGSDKKPPVLEWIEAVATAKKPVIAAVSGPAIGIGATILLHCDLVYADPSAYLHMPFTDLATVPEAGASYILPRRFGRQIAAEFFLLCEKVSAQRAYDMGIVNAVITDGPVRDHAVKIAERIAQKPPQAIAMTKALMTVDVDDMKAHIGVEAEQFASRLQSPEMQQVIMAMMSKKS